MDEIAKLRVLCDVAGIFVPDEDTDLLIVLLENQRAATEALLSIDTQDLEPITSFDPRWE